ncbi:hypothetical protein Purlil1_1980 [Purpureocillium lilacinum]|uniref:RING-type domain-containing protein n=1 Tax=Purpureocillium lilacinum TaxID=33203 RepID=A0ABR0CCL3_PURLI|nr:hypothetical protein Purlil1_1980 [Purpureocillium lilacinum]
MIAVPVPRAPPATRTVAAAQAPGSGSGSSRYHVSTAVASLSVGLIFSLILAVYVFKGCVWRLPGCSRCRRRHREGAAAAGEEEAAHDDKPRNLGLGRDMLESLPIVVYTPGSPYTCSGGRSELDPDAVVKNDERHCAICTEGLDLGVKLRHLPCGHRFHPDCIDPWLLERSRTCPLCRTDALEAVVVPRNVVERPRRALLAGRWRRVPSSRPPRGGQTVHELQMLPLTSVPTVHSPGPGTSWAASVALQAARRPAPLPPVPERARPGA